MDKSKSWRQNLHQRQQNKSCYTQLNFIKGVYAIADWYIHPCPLSIFVRLETGRDGACQQSTIVVYNGILVPPSLINVLHNLFVFRYRHKGQLPLTLFRQKYRLGSLHLGGYGRRAPRLARSRECFRCKVTHFSGTPCVRHGKICRKFKLIVPHAQTSGIMSYICTRFFRAMSRERWEDPLGPPV